MSVTIRDVAEKANVSIATVSRVLNNEPNVRDETRLAVLNAAKELGYKLDITMSFLRKETQASKRIGVFIGGDLTRLSYDPFNIEILEGIASGGAQRGCEIVYISRDEINNSEDMLDALTAKRLDALIVMFCDYELISQFKKLNTPLVVINLHFIDRDLSYILFDNFGGAQEATDYLLTLGHERIAFLCGTYDGKIEVSLEERFAGYRFALESRGMEFDPQLVVKENLSLEPPGIRAGYIGMNALLSSGKSFTAVVAANDLLAFGACNAMNEKGIRIPDDISIVGFDDLSSAAHLMPPLTTVRVSREEVGRAAVERAVENIDSGRIVRVVTRVSTGLVIRESCAQRI